MEKVTLTAEKRSLLGKKLGQLRRDDLLPAVVFSHGKESIPLSLPFKDFMRVYETVGESGLLELNIGEGHKPLNVIVSGLDLHPVTGFPYHANLRQVSLTEKITTRVPIVLSGDSPIVKSGEGMVLHLINELEVTCLPQDIPHEITVDISKLEQIDDAIAVSDLAVDRTKVDIETDAEELVVKIDYAQQQEEEEETPVDEATLVEGVEATAEKPAEEAGSETSEEEKE